MIRLSVVVVAALIAPEIQADAPPLPNSFGGETPLQWSVRMADSDMARRGDSLAWKEGGKAKWDYAGMPVPMDGMPIVLRPL